MVAHPEADVRICGSDLVIYDRSRGP